MLERSDTFWQDLAAHARAERRAAQRKAANFRKRVLKACGVPAEIQKDTRFEARRAIEPEGAAIKKLIDPQHFIAELEKPGECMRCRKPTTRCTIIGCVCEECAR